MVIVLGLDIGTTSTAGTLIGLPDQNLGLVSRPVALHSEHVGWAEEDPNQWWSNVCEIVRELLQSTGCSPADIGAVGVAGMLPAVVLLDDAGRLLRPSIQQSDARCSVEVAELRAEVDEHEFLAKTGNGVNQQLVAGKLRWIAKHEPRIFARIRTVFGSYDYVNWRLTGERAIEQNWALEAGFVDLGTNAIDDNLIALARISRSAVPRKVASHEIIGFVSNGRTGRADGSCSVGQRPAVRPSVHRRAGFWYQRVERHIADGNRRIERQRAILTNMERDGHNGLVQARVLLEGLMESQLLHRDYRQRILIKIKRNGL